MSRPQARLELVLGIAVGSLFGLWRLVPTPSNPASASWSDLDFWYRLVGPGAATLAAVRVGALGGALWLLAVCLLQLVSERSVGRSLRPIADRVVPVALRRFAGVSLSAGLLVAPPLVDGGVDAPGTASMRPMPDEATSSTTVTATTVPTAPATQATPVVVEPSRDHYVVARSESFWSIAADRVGEALRRTPTESEVLAYWERLIEANRARLVDPGNADLLFAGQLLTLPLLADP